MTDDTPLNGLADLIGDLVLGLVQPGGNGGGLCRPASLEVTLPVETWLEPATSGTILRTNLPRTRLRTSFDRPVGRLVIHIAAAGAA